jgi:preprotein translocase subunit SecG
MTGYTASVNIMIVVVIVIVVVVFTLRSEIGLDSMFSGHVNARVIVLKSVPENVVYFGA